MRFETRDGREVRLSVELLEQLDHFLLGSGLLDSLCLLLCAGFELTMRDAHRIVYERLKQLGSHSQASAGTSTDAV